MLKKKWMIGILLLCFVWQKGALHVLAQENLSLYASYAAVTDAETGRVILEKKGFQQVPMASTTKVLTCIIALEQADLSDKVSVSSYAAQMPQVRMGIRKGEQYLLEDLLYALMLESYNDVAVAIAEHVGGSVEGFADLMNQKAAQICDEQFYFITPNGLDASGMFQGETKEHSITAVNLSRIMSYCCFYSPRKDSFLKITRTKSCSIKSLPTKGHAERSFSLTNHNRMLSDERVISGKTGFTGKAGYCYVSGVVIQEFHLGISLLACGWPNHKTYKWSDMNTLLTYLSDHLTYHSISAADVSLSPVRVKNLCHTIGNDNTDEIRVELQNPEWKKSYAGLSDEKCISCINIQKELKAPLQKDMQIGTCEWYIGETKVAAMPILVGENYQSNTYKNCLIHTFNKFLTICINSQDKY